MVNITYRLNIDPVRLNTFDVLLLYYSTLLNNIDGLIEASQTDVRLSEYIEKVINEASIRYGTVSTYTDLSQGIQDIFKLTLSLLNSIRPPLVSYDDFTKKTFAISAIPREFVSRPYNICLLECATFAHDLAVSFYNRTEKIIEPLSNTDINIQPSKNTYLAYFSSRSHKNPEIQFYFSPNSFQLYDFLNLPFYLFHEFCSHIYAAPMFSDTLKQRSPLRGIFEDGWLLYTEFDVYWDAIAGDKLEWLKIDALNDYIYKATQTSKVVYKGFELAKWFYRQVLNSNSKAFQSYSLFLSSQPYDIIPYIMDFQSEFCLAVDNCRKLGKGDYLKRLIDPNNLLRSFEKVIIEFPVT